MPGVAAPPGRLALLQELASAPQGSGVPKRLSKRASLVLACLHGNSIRSIAQTSGVSAPTVRLWRKRFDADGIAGLADAPRSGRRPSHGDTLDRIRRALKTESPDGKKWHGRTLSSKIQIKPHVIWRSARRSRLTLDRHRTWQHVTDSPFVPAMVEVVGLCLHPPSLVLLLLVGQPAPPGERTGCLFIRNGRLSRGLKRVPEQPVSLGKALEVAVQVGEQRAATTWKPPHLRTAVEAVIQDQPADQHLHVLHTGPGLGLISTWVKRHQVSFHALPSTETWLHLASSWIRITSQPEPHTESVTQLLKSLSSLIQYRPGNTPVVWWKRPKTADWPPVDQTVLAKWNPLRPNIRSDTGPTTEPADELLHTGRSLPVPAGLPGVGHQ